MNEMKDLRTAVLLGIGVYAFYLLTLAPTVLWGDDAFFQSSAAAGYLQPDGGGHWLHFVLGQLFIQLPVGDVAYRVNLLSAVAGAVTVALVYSCGRSLELSNSAALAGALSIAVAHTYWTHAVRAEVYTVFMMMLALIWWQLLGWREDRPSWVYTALYLIGPALLSHQMMILILPALALFLWQRRSWLKLKEWLFALLAFGVGIAVAIWLIHLQVDGDAVVGSLTTFFTRSGTDFAQAIFDFSPNTLLSDVGLWLGLLGLQFVGPALILAVLGIGVWRDRPTVLWPLLVFYMTTVLFASTYRVNDSYVFYLPGYLVIALLIGQGWQWLAEKRPSLARPALPSLVVIPILVYAIAPFVLKSVTLPFPNIRELPGREPVTFFVWPSKAGYEGASDYGRSALNTVAPDSVLLADHTPYETLNYLQSVEGLRPDVTLIEVDATQNLRAVIGQVQTGRLVYLANDNPAYYNLTSLGSRKITPLGVVYLIEHD